MRRWRPPPIARAPCSTACAGISTTSLPNEPCPGPGLVNLYNALAQLDGVPARGYTAAQITDLAIRARDPLCVETTAMFCAMLGTMAGNLAMTLGAHGGVYIGGGIVPKLGQTFTIALSRAL